MIEKEEALLMAYDSDESTPEEFIELLETEDEVYYRIPYQVNFGRFAKASKFIVLFAESGSKGKITAWGLCDPNQSHSEPDRQNPHSYHDLQPSLEGNPNEKRFLGYFCFTHMGTFDEPYDVTDLRKAKDEAMITDLRVLRSPTYVLPDKDIIDEILEEIE
jgi:hypothetical protein